MNNKLLFSPKLYLSFSFRIHQYSFWMLFPPRTSQRTPNESSRNARRHTLYCEMIMLFFRWYAIMTILFFLFLFFLNCFHVFYSRVWTILIEFNLLPQPLFDLNELFAYFPTLNIAVSTISVHHHHTPHIISECHHLWLRAARSTSASRRSRRRRGCGRRNHRKNCVESGTETNESNTR